MHVQYVKNIMPFVSIVKIRKEQKFKIQIKNVYVLMETCITRLTIN